MRYLEVGESEQPHVMYVAFGTCMTVGHRLNFQTPMEYRLEFGHAKEKKLFSNQAIVTRLGNADF